MRSGKSKTLQEHIIEGTYRPDLHGINPSKLDLQRLTEMKDTLYHFFNKTERKLRKTNKRLFTEKHKLINDIMLYQIKTYHLLIKYKIIEQ